jgi:prepilin-type N-terminal cleavage/methylation domain-containing protein
MDARTRESGFTLVEVLAALAIFGLLAAGMGPIFLQQLKHNRLAELTTEGMGAAQIVLDRLRTQDPATLPATGTGAPQTLLVGTHTYTVTPSYCENTSFCTSTTVRHITVRVTYAGQQVFQTQTVYAQLR